MTRIVSVDFAVATADDIVTSLNSEPELESGGKLSEITGQEPLETSTNSQWVHNRRGRFHKLDTNTPAAPASIRVPKSSSNLRPNSGWPASEM